MGICESKNNTPEQNKTSRASDIAKINKHTE